MTWEEIKAWLGGKPTEPVTTTPPVEIISESFVPSGLTIGALTSKDKASANSMAIRKTIAKFGRVDFPSGRLQLAEDVRVPSGCEINGFPSRENPTIIGPMAASPNVAARGDNGEWFSVFNTNVPAGNNPRVGERYGIPEGPSHNVTISNLVIDCAFDDQINDLHGAKTTCQGVSIEGCGLKLVSVKVRNAARGYAGGECFPLRIVAPQARVYGASRTVVLDCEVTDPGYAFQTHNGGAGCEITCITVAGSAGNIIENPLIAQCRVYGMARNSKQPSPIHALHTAYTRGAVISGNYVADVDGVGYYVDTGKSWHTQVSGNTLVKVHKGVFLNAVTDFEQNDMDVSNNVIELMDTSPGWLMDNPPSGVQFQKAGNIQATSGFNRVHCEGNRIIGRGGNLKGVGSLGYFPRGFYFRFDNKAFAKNLSVFRNTIDVPLFDNNEYYYKQKDSLALYFATRSAWDTANPMVRMVGNLNPLGVPMNATIVGDDFRPSLSMEQLKG